MKASVLASSLHDRILETSARSYRLSGYTVWTKHSGPSAAGADPFDLVVPDLRRIEEIETSDSLPKADVDRLQKCRNAGMEVWVLVPLAEVGRAHGMFRGAADKIVPWWEGPEKVHFGDPQLP